VHALFEHCVKRRLVESNPIAAIDKVKLVDKAPEILTPEQLSRLLLAAPFNLLPLLTIQAFAGLRTEETMRLDWSEVDQVRGHIMVSAKKAKTARRRLIPIASNLAQFLRLYAGDIGPVWPQGGRVYHKAINQLRSAIGMPYWPQNALRHSFASYHLAKHSNASELMLYMGHTRLLSHDAPLSKIKREADGPTFRTGHYQRGSRILWPPNASAFFWRRYSL
jgi:integrase